MESPLQPSLDKIISDYHSDADFTWTDIEVGALVRAIEKARELLVGDGSTRGLVETQMALNDAWTVLAYD